MKSKGTDRLSRPGLGEGGGGEGLEGLVQSSKRLDFVRGIHRIHKWRTGGKKLVPGHEREALEGKQKLQMKTFSELAGCLARIPPKITLY